MQLDKCLFKYKMQITIYIYFQCIDFNFDNILLLQ